MKQILTILAVCLLAVVVNAQRPEQGKLLLRPMLGVSFSNHGVDRTLKGNYGEIDELHAKYKVGFAGGAEVGYQVLDWLQASAGLLFSQQGSKYEERKMTDKYEEIKGNVNMDYLVMPVLANFYVWEGLALKIGVQPGLLLSCKRKVDGNTTDMKEFCKDFQLQVPVGISYDYQKFVLDFRLNIPVNKCCKKEIDDDAMNNTVSLTLGYNFEL